MRRRGVLLVVAVLPDGSRSLIPAEWTDWSTEQAGRTPADLPLGHYQYFGVIFNDRSLRVFKDCVVPQWRKALGKRSQKGRMTWATYRQLLTAFPLPEPVIHQAWKQ